MSRYGLLPTYDYALERQNELIKMEYEKAQKENKDLKAENEKLKRALKKKEVAFIKGL